MTRLETLSKNSSYVENALRHIFLADLFKAVWERNYDNKIHIYNAEVDDSGFDLVARMKGVLRHIQLKKAHTNAKAQYITASIELASVEGGCIVWMFHDLNTLAIDHYLFFDATSEFSNRPPARGRRNITGERSFRDGHRKIPRNEFLGPITIHELLDVLYPGARPSGTIIPTERS
jgi:hypothetical protein